jgi:hypothetical protein
VARVAAGAGVELDPTAWRNFRVVEDSADLVLEAGEGDLGKLT